MDLRELPEGTIVRHPWEIVRAGFFLGIVRDYLGAAGREVLDLGAGDGYLAERLLAEVPAVAAVTCFDPGYSAAWLARARRPGLRFTAAPPSTSFDAALLLDVLEHADDDAGLLAQAIARVRPGGLVLLSVPAHAALYSHHDRLLGHRRRYSPRQLRDLATGARLDVVASGSLFASLLVPRALAKLVEAVRRPPSAAALGHVETSLGTWHHGGVLTRTLATWLAADAALARTAARRGWPWPGLSTWVLGRRP